MKSFDFPRQDLVQIWIHALQLVFLLLLLLHIQNGVNFALGFCLCPYTILMSNRRFSLSLMTESQAEVVLQDRLVELEKLEHVETLTSKMTHLLQKLSSQLSQIDSGSESVANVTANWIQIVRAVSLAANSMMVYNEEDFKNSSPTTERLVRCALDELGTIVNTNKDELDNLSHNEE
jgi:DASH complex subunit DAD2